MSSTVPVCLSIQELARRWRCRVSTVRAMIRRGELPAIRLPGSRGPRITPEAIRAAEEGALAAITSRQRRCRQRIDPEIERLLEC